MSQIASTVAAVGFVAFGATIGLGHVLRRAAIQRSLLDQPNERSLHSVPVPRFGGVAVVSVALPLVSVVIALTLRDKRQLVAWLLGALATALLGLVDDLRQLSSRLRLALQVLIAAGALVGLGVPEQLLLWPGMTLALPRAATLALEVFIVVGALNVYNFMDGMDGLAGMQAVTASLALALAFLVRGSYELAAVAGVIACTVSGFLMLNFPPAAMFMGDAGSTFLGFGLVTLPLASMREPSPLPLGCVAVALAPFMMDGTFTLFRRALRGERVWQAHRTHIYQRLVATGLQHREVLIPYTGWMALCAAAAVLGADGLVLSVAAGACLCGFVVMLRWLAVREAEVRSEKPVPR